jgi:carbamoyl-phosphate synthase small subunit
MQRPNQEPAILLLEDGRMFKGKAIGAKGTSGGEIAFNTGMTGYQEIFTDPSYYGQVVVMASSHIGNYGVHQDETESDKPMISGLVVKKFSQIYSRPSGSGGLQEYLADAGVVGISDIDTRALVQHIRDNGAMNCIISSEILNPEELKQKLLQVPDMNGMALSDLVSTKTSYEVGDRDSLFRVALVDFGVKKNIIRCLSERGALVKVFPNSTGLEEVLSWRPDGIMLSNGPGDPSAMRDEINLVKQLLNTGLPIFGICLGHQLLALSLGLKTKKMHHGHRGINHPIKNLITGKCEVTSQNHGFVVDLDGVSDEFGVEITHVHLNDGTVAGIRLTGRPVFSVQYHPEASPGPHDSRYLFDRFIENMVKSKSMAETLS